MIFLFFRKSVDRFRFPRLTFPQYRRRERRLIRRVREALSFKAERLTAEKRLAALAYPLVFAEEIRGIELHPGAVGAALHYYSAIFRRGDRGDAHPFAVDDEVMVEARANLYLRVAGVDTVAQMISVLF